MRFQERVERGTVGLSAGSSPGPTGRGLADSALPPWRAAAGPRCGTAERSAKHPVKTLGGECTAASPPAAAHLAHSPCASRRRALGTGEIRATGAGESFLFPSFSFGARLKKQSAPVEENTLEPIERPRLGNFVETTRRPIISS
jgi:hypothetical protein